MASKRSSVLRDALVALWTNRKTDEHRDLYAQAVRHIDTSRVELVNGEWYAFDLAGRKFYATVYNNGLTGHLELTEIPDPYLDNERIPGAGHPTC